MARSGSVYVRSPSSRRAPPPPLTDAPSRTEAPGVRAGAKVAERGTGAASGTRSGAATASSVICATSSSTGSSTSSSSEASAARASRSRCACSRRSASSSTPRAITSALAIAPAFAPPKSAAKPLRTGPSASTSPMPVRTAIQAASAPIGVRRLATPFPAIDPISPPCPGKMISMIARSAGSAAAASAARRIDALLFSARRSNQMPKAISAGGRSQRPAPNQGARMSRSASARSPRPGRIKPTASTTPVTAKARKTSVRAAAPLTAREPPPSRLRGVRLRRATLDLYDNRYDEWSSPCLTVQEARDRFAQLRLDQASLRAPVALMLD